MEKYLKVEDILDCTNGKLIIGDKNTICKRFQRDSRLIKKDDVFIAIKGKNFNGNLYIEQALENGAKVVIITEFNNNLLNINKFEDRTIIKVENEIEALQKIATKKREIYGSDFPVIAVTGSVGKTSTKEAIASVLSEKYKVLKTQGNLNNDIGVPLTILSLQDEDIAVIELGMNHFGEIARLAKIIKPNIAVITNIGTSHIGNLGSRENILKAKLEVLSGMKTPYLVINNDNDLLHNWYENNKNTIQIKTFGIKNKSDINATNIRLHDFNSTYMCNTKDSSFKVNINVPGEHYVLNTLCAALIGKLLKIKDEEIKDGIQRIEITKKRMEIIKTKDDIKIINDSYNASLESMKASIKYLSDIEKGRKIAVLGDILELGEFSEKIHSMVGEEVAKNKIDILLCQGENSKFIAQGAIKAGMKENKIINKETLEELYNELRNILYTGDNVLIKASNGMKFYELAEKLSKE